MIEGVLFIGSTFVVGASLMATLYPVFLIKGQQRQDHGESGHYLESNFI